MGKGNSRLLPSFMRRGRGTQAGKRKREPETKTYWAD